MYSVHCYCYCFMVLMHSPADLGTGFVLEYQVLPKDRGSSQLLLLLLLLNNNNNAVINRKKIG